MEKVFYGPNTMNVAMAGRKVSEVIASVRDAFSLQNPDNIQAFINGNQVDRNYVVQPEDRIELRAAMGSKG